MICSATHRAFAIIAAIVLCLCLAVETRGTESTGDEASSSPQIGDTAWYSSEDGLKPVHVDPIEDDSLNRNSRWLPKADKVKKQTAPAGAGAGGTTGGSGGSSGTLGLVILLLIAGVIGAVIVYAISKTEVEMDPIRSRSLDLSAPDQQTIERMKHLPAELRRTDVNLRSEAERLMNEAQYDQALILLFGHQLLLLDRHSYLRLNRGKTNRKYVRETRSTSEEVGARLEATVRAFERSYFGNHPTPQAAFSELWQSNLSLEHAVVHSQGTVA